MTVEEYRKLAAKPAKYRNKRVVNACGRFDSVKEYDRWCELRSLELIGVIADLRRQVRYEIIPAQYGADGKLLENAAVYTADFVYERNGDTVVEDVKGVRTKDYILRRKLMLQVHGIRILET